MRARFHTGLLMTVALLVSAPPAARAQRILDLTFSTLGLGGVATRVNEIAADQTNRVWVATDGGVSAIIGDQRDPNFSVRAPTLLSNLVLAVTFGNVAGEENFFLGYPEGMQHGRVTSTTGFQIRGTLLTGDPDLDFVNELASDGATTVWAATRGGLVAWDLTTGQTPTFDDPAFLPGSLVSHVAVAPWGDAVCSVGQELFVVQRGGPRSPVRFALLGGSIRSLAFDQAGNLWLTTESNPQAVVRFDVNGTADGLVNTPVPFQFGISNRSPADIAVDLFTDEVWVTTVQSNALTTSREGPYSQLPDGLLNLAPDGWNLDTQLQRDPTFVVYTDPSGNVWTGTDQGVRARIVRLLTLDQSTYLGEGAVATAVLEDLPEFGDNGVPGETATVSATVGGASQDLQATEEGDTGRFTFTFGLATVGSVPGPDGVAVSVEYAFVDAQGIDRALTALARWANIVDFKDEVILGVCFLEALGR